MNSHVVYWATSTLEVTFQMICGEHNCLNCKRFPTQQWVISLGWCLYFPQYSIVDWCEPRAKWFSREPSDRSSWWRRGALCPSGRQPEGPRGVWHCFYPQQHWYYHCHLLYHRYHIISYHILSYHQHQHHHHRYQHRLELCIVLISTAALHNVVLL